MSSTAGVAVVAEGVTKRFGSVVALDDVSISLEAPAIGLLGANGAGKSTFMRVLLALVRPEKGSMRVLGMDAQHAGTALHRRIGYMPEHECLPRGMAARDLVVHLAELRGLPRRAAVLRASEVLFQVGLEEERNRLIGTFSTGMRQRVKLAQALVHGPELVVLDEPTNGLDPAGREEMLEIVRRLSSDLGIRVLLSSHVLEDVARTCDAVVVLREGKLVTAGRIEELVAGSGTSMRVRVTGDIAGFAHALAEAGLAASPDGDELIVAGASDEALDALRDAAVASGVSLRELRPAERTLEDAVIGAME